MKTTATRTVFAIEIDAVPRRSLEQLVGQPLANDDKVRIIVTKPRVAPDSTTKATALADMQRVLAKTAAQQVNEADAGEAVDAALESVRDGRDA